MVAGLDDRIEYVVVFDQVPAPAPVIDGNAGSRDVVNCVVIYFNTIRHGYETSSRLLADSADRINQAPRHRTFLRKVTALRAGRDILPAVGNAVIIADGITPGTRGIAHKGHGTLTESLETAVYDRAVTVVVVEEHTVTACLIEEAVSDRAVFGAGQHHGSGPYDGPVSAVESLPVCLRLQGNPVGVTELDALDGYVSDRFL